MRGRTNKFYTIVDESHTALTKQVMDRMLNGKTQNHLDTGWTLTPKNSDNANAKKEAAEAAPFVTHVHKSTSDTPYESG